MRASSPTEAPATFHAVAPRRNLIATCTIRAQIRLLFTIETAPLVYTINYAPPWYNSNIYNNGKLNSVSGEDREVSEDERNEMQEHMLAGTPLGRLGRLPEVA